LLYEQKDALSPYYVPGGYSPTLKAKCFYQGFLKKPAGKGQGEIREDIITGITRLGFHVES
jgi:hypothetical protein